MSEMLFLKLGGSLLTDKSGIEAVRPAVLARLATEIAGARDADPQLRLLLGHGSGSYGHVAAARFGTRQGVYTREEWSGFAKVSASAARLNRLVIEELLAAGVPAVTVQPSASAGCVDGRLTTLDASSIRSALDAGLLPVIYGDVAFDSIRGGTIISTEEIMSFLAAEFDPAWLLLAGETRGAYDEQGVTIPTITQSNLADVKVALGGSSGTDVTGGMKSKVMSMLDLVSSHPRLKIRIFSGLDAGMVRKVLLHPEDDCGTLIRL